MCRAARWHADHHAEDVHAHHAVEVGEVVVEEAAAPAADPGVVAHDVEPAELLDREVDDRLHLVGVGDVGLLERGRRAELRGQRLAALGVDVGDDDLRALLARSTRRCRDRCRRRRR